MLSHLAGTCVKTLQHITLPRMVHTIRFGSSVTTWRQLSVLQPACFFSTSNNSRDIPNGPKGRKVTFSKNPVLQEDYLTNARVNDLSLLLERQSDSFSTAEVK